MLENGKEMSQERKEYIKNTIMSVLFELYEDQTGEKYTWEQISPKDKTA